MLAKEKRAEEHKPCAIIIVIEEFHPQFVLDIVPATSSPIWPTEE